MHEAPTLRPARAGERDSLKTPPSRAGPLFEVLSA